MADEEEESVRWPLNKKPGVVNVEEERPDT